MVDWSFRESLGNLFLTLGFRVQGLHSPSMREWHYEMRCVLICSLHLQSRVSLSVSGVGFLFFCYGIQFEALRVFKVRIQES